jgi:hypothetical protein
MLTKQVKYQKVNQMLKGKIKRNLNLKLKKMNIILGYETIIFDSYRFFVKVNKYILKKPLN